MQVILDNISAVLITGVIILMLGLFTRNRQEDQIDGVRFYAGHASMLDLAEMIERDFHNIGSGVAAADPMILDFQWDAADKRLEFMATIDTVATAPIEQIKYELDMTAKVATMIDGTPDSVQCYEVNRYVFDAGAYKLTGKSMTTVTDLDIVLLRADSTIVGANLDDTRIIDVFLSGLSPLGEDQIVQRYRWQTRFQPINLTLKN